MKAFKPTLRISLITCLAGAAAFGCKARKDGAGVRDESADAADLDGSDLNAELSALAAAIEGDASKAYEISALEFGNRDLALADTDRALTPAELVELKRKATAVTAEYKKAQAAFDKAEREREDAKIELTTKLEAAVAALSKIHSSDTERYKQGLADLQRAVDALNKISSPAVATNPPVKPTPPVTPPAPVTPAPVTPAPVTPTPVVPAKPVPPPAVVCEEVRGGGWLPKVTATNSFVYDPAVTAYDLSKANCETLVKGRNNGLICSIAKTHWGIFREVDGRRISGNQAGYALALRTFDSCVTAVQSYSTPKYACVASGIAICAANISTATWTDSDCYDGNDAWTACRIHINTK